MQRLGWGLRLRISFVIRHSSFQLASVIGLAPIRPGLKDRLRELLCIHGRKWPPRLVLRQRLLVFSEALICLELLGELVVPAGNTPASSGYQPGALLLSYRTYGKLADGVGIAPTQPGGSLGFRDRGIAALPTIRNEMVRVAGVAPTTSSFRTRPSAADIKSWKKWYSRKESHLHPRR